MNKIGCYFYNIFFWISRFITILIFGICFFSVLNAKYVWSENFFNIFNLNVDSIPDYLDNNLPEILKNYFQVNWFSFGDYEYEIYKAFCINSQSIDILLIAFFSILLIYFIIKHVIKQKQLILSIILEIFIIYFLIYLFNKNITLLIIALISGITFVIIYLLNAYLPMQKIIKLFPVIGEICCINSIVSFINKKHQQSNLYILIISLLLSNAICIFIHIYTDKDLINLVKLEQEYSVRPYTHSITPYKDKLIISGYNEIIIIDENGHDTHIQNSKFGMLEEILINNEEIFVYDILLRSLLILDADSLDIKKEINITKYHNLSLNDFAKICFNKEHSKLLFVFDTFKLILIIDTKDYKLINKYYGKDVNLYNDSVVYNKYRDSFLVTFYQNENLLQEIDLKNNRINNIKASINQGYITISEQNKEVYVAFHQQGRIGVYDAETMELKRKIKSSYAIKNITYDEDLNVLISPSYLTGYVDIFLMDGSDKLLKRQFVGYELRQAKFDAKKENLYVCSRIGLYKVPINIRELIENVSHETNN